MDYCTFVPNCYKEILESGRYDALRPRYLKMYLETQAREIRKLVAWPDFMLGSVLAVTGDGMLVATSATGSQPAPYVGSAGRLNLVVGRQKIVPNLQAAFWRIREYVVPGEDPRVREVPGVGTIVGMTLLIAREWLAGRTTVILIRVPTGV